jgi:hypothetical protein
MNMKSVFAGFLRNASPGGREHTAEQEIKISTAQGRRAHREEEKGFFVLFFLFSPRLHARSVVDFFLCGLPAE